MDRGISVVLNTWNEENNLRYALRSVHSWVDEIVVVDMYSEDRTVAVAREFGARVYFHERLGFADPARAYAIDQSTGDWILMLDADELVPAPLSRRLLEVAGRDEADVVVIPWVNYFMGSPLMHTGWGPHQDRHERFFKRGSVRVTGRVHNFLEVAPGARVIALPYQPGVGVVHFNYVDTTHFLDKLNRYTSIEALQVLDRGVRPTYLRALLHAAREFLVRYIKKAGYRDGWRGLYLSLFMAHYRLATYAKLAELERVGSREQVESLYLEIAESILEEYERGSAK